MVSYQSQDTPEQILFLETVGFSKDHTLILRQPNAYESPLKIAKKQLNYFSTIARTEIPSGTSFMYPRYSIVTGRFDSSSVDKSIAVQQSIAEPMF